MKNRKKYIMAFVLIMVFVTALGLTACGNGKDGGKNADNAKQKEYKLYAGFYRVDIPKDFTVDDYEIQFKRASEDSLGSYDEVITVSIEKNEGTAEEQRNESIAYFGEDNRKAGDDVSFGDLTWKTEYYTWDDDRPSISLYADLDDGVVAQVDALCMDLDNKTLKNFMKTITFEDNPYDAYWEFMTE